MEHESYSSIAGQAHSGGGGDFPKFLADKRFTVRLNETKTAAGLEYWDADADNGKGGKGLSKMTASPITGPLIGKAMGMQAFKKQGKVWYRSTPFFSKKDEVAVFETANGVSKKVFNGTAEDAKKFILGESGSAVKTFQILYLAVEGKTGSHVVQVNTNLSLAIHDLKTVKMDSFKTHCMTVTPVVANKEELKKKLDKIAREALSAILDSDKEDDQIGYGQISVGELITPEMEQSFGRKGRTVVSMVKEFITWRDSVNTSKTDETVDGNKVANTTSNPQSKFQAAPSPTFEATNTAAPVVNNDEIPDDLPF